MNDATTLPIDWPPLLESVLERAVVFGFTEGEPHELADLTSPGTRDYWVRWGIRTEGAYTLLVPASPENDRAQDSICARWRALADDPVALRAALLRLHPWPAGEAA